MFTLGSSRQFWGEILEFEIQSWLAKPKKLKWKESFIPTIIFHCFFPSNIPYFMDSKVNIFLHFTNITGNEMMAW